MANNSKRPGKRSAMQPVNQAKTSVKKKKSSAQGLPEYTGRYPKPKLRFRLRVVFFIFLSCLLIGLVFYLLGVNFDLFSY